VLVDVDEKTFNISVGEVEKKITPRTKAVVPVHLFGQCANMRELLPLAKQRAIAVIEDSAQALGAVYKLNDGPPRHAGTMGKIGITSFFPTKTLGCFGDGGAMFTADAALAERVQMIANHGQRVKYTHELIGVNSRLDTLQAALLDVKLRHVQDLTSRRQLAAEYYNRGLKGLEQVERPYRDDHSSHVFHQYTIKVADRERLREHLRQSNIPSMVYYPTPLHFQEA
jgi:UDP-2-acetamido-2-deoxy-ribo-hexuluronate aminotransferase